MAKRERESKSAAKSLGGRGKVEEAAIVPRQYLPPQSLPARPEILYTDHEAVVKVRNSEGRGNGEYKTMVDEEALFELAKTHASYQAMARILKVDVHILYDKQPDGSDGPNMEVIKRARAVKQDELRHAQFQAAISDRNPTMLIWMGKQHLGQKDTPAEIKHTGKFDHNHNHKHKVTMVAHIPTNGRDLDPARAEHVTPRALQSGEVEDADVIDEAVP